MLLYMSVSLCMTQAFIFFMEHNFIINAFLLGILIKKKIRLDYGILFKNLFKMCLAGIITFILCYLAVKGFDRYVILPKYIFELLK